MISIGIRVTPKKVYYAVIECNNSNNTTNILTYDNISVPLSFETPDQLSFIRNTMFSIINEYNIDSAGIRTIETNSKGNISYERIYIEGVLQELISNCNIVKYFAGKKSKIASLLSIKVQNLTDILDNDVNYFSVEGWGKLSLEYRECLTCAIATKYL